MKKTKGTDYSKMLIWAAALVSIVRYSASFIASDAATIPAWLSDVITFLMAISGIGMGILGAFGTAYLFDGWRHAMPAAGKAWPFRFQVLTLFVFGLFVTELCILVPFTVSRITAQTMHAALGDYLVWAWGGFVNLAPILLIGGVSVGNQVVSVNQAGNAPENSAWHGGKTPENSTPKSDKSARRWTAVRAFMSDAELDELSRLPVEEICKRYKFPMDSQEQVDSSKRLARGWRQKAADEIKEKAVQP